ncbi:uncharacterized protein [Euphorbia lathyris]|uniref:uncharacterized protein isoform X2 n=1 Tax=Euphorbia lathyris TaxID=212925 RepID=UPI00331350D9
MVHFLCRRWRFPRATLPSTLPPIQAAKAGVNGFRSDAALEALENAREEKITNLVLYNYPSFSGAFGALIAHLFLSRLNLSFLILPFSTVEPIRVEDLRFEGLEKCYLLDFLGPPRFAAGLSQQSMCEVIGFDHRKSVLSRKSCIEACPERVKFLVDIEKSSSRAVYDYFSSKLVEMKFPNLLEINSTDLIAKGNSIISFHGSSARKLLDKVFKVRLGRGFYGECLGVRADGNSKLSDEMGRQLSVNSAAAGLRPIGAVIYMQRNNLKMCLRSTDSATDTMEVSKAYGGGGSPSSSSFIIRMDEYNLWLSNPDNAS